MGQTTFRPSEAERYLELGKNSIYSLIKKGKIPSELVDGRYVIQLADLEAFKAERGGDEMKRNGKKGKKKAKRKHMANRMSKREELPETPHAFADTDELIGAFQTLSKHGFTHVGRSPEKVSPTADILGAFATLREHGITGQ